MFFFASLCLFFISNSLSSWCFKALIWTFDTNGHRRINKPCRHEKVNPDCSVNIHRSLLGTGENVKRHRSSRAFSLITCLFTKKKKRSSVLFLSFSDYAIKRFSQPGTPAFSFSGFRTRRAVIGDYRRCKGLYYPQPRRHPSK